MANRYTGDLRIVFQWLTVLKIGAPVANSHPRDLINTAPVANRHKRDLRIGAPVVNSHTHDFRIGAPVVNSLKNWCSSG